MDAYRPCTTYFFDVLGRTFELVGPGPDWDVKSDEHLGYDEFWGVVRHIDGVWRVDEGSDELSNVMLQAISTYITTHGVPK